MPNRRTHEYVGITTGTVYAAYDAKEQNLEAWLAESVGGAVGGWLGGALPDLMEPAVGPWHRDVGHSCTVGATILFLRDLLATWAETCRARANEYAAMQTAAHNGPHSIDALESFFLKLVELFWRFLAGALNGLAAGYLSHLALDAMTPGSIPVLTAH